MIYVKFLKLHIPFIDDNISEHPALLSAFLNKGLTAFGASDLYPALSSRDPDLLPAGRASVNVMGSALFQVLPQIGEIPLHPVLVIHISVILKAALVRIPGKHPEISEKKARQPSQIKAPHAKYGNHKKYQGKRQQKAIKRIVSIASHHKSV